jgi:hypothetical protein
LAVGLIRKFKLSPKVPIVSDSTPDPSADATVQRSVADELVKLAALRDRGFLTDVDFIEEKARLLAHA